MIERAAQRRDVQPGIDHLGGDAVRVRRRAGKLEGPRVRADRREEMLPPASSISRPVSRKTYKIWPTAGSRPSMKCRSPWPRLLG